MTNNMANIDRIIRAVVGVVLLSLIFFLPDTPWRWAGLFGIVLLATAATGWCPGYSILGVSTRGKGE